MSRDKPCAVFPCRLDILRILLLLEGVLRDDAVELFRGKGVAIVSKNQSVILYSDLDDDFIELVAHIFSILD